MDKQKGLSVLAIVESRHCNPVALDHPSEPAEPRTILVVGQSKAQKNYMSDPFSHGGMKTGILTARNTHHKLAHNICGLVFVLLPSAN